MYEGFMKLEKQRDGSSPTFLRRNGVVLTMIPCFKFRETGFSFLSARTENLDILFFNLQCQQ